MHPMHSEAKQTKMLKFGAERGLLQEPSKENRQFMLKMGELLSGVGRFFRFWLYPQGLRDLSSPARLRLLPPALALECC